VLVGLLVVLASDQQESAVPLFSSHKASNSR
jgi:hypothetical protein